MLQPARRVVTGTSLEGRPVFISDEQVEAYRPALTHPSGGVHPVWGANQPVPLPTAGEHFDFDPPMPPPPGGFRTYLLDIIPESWAQPDARAIGTQLHQTPTVDVLYVVHGEIWLELEGGEERLLKAGDIIVQNGTRHAWHNRSDRVCRLAAVVVAASSASGTS